MQKKKYTFLCEYQKGTYISQHIAEGLNEALLLWLYGLDSTIFTENKKNKIGEMIKNEMYNPVLLNGFESVWCSSYTIHNSLLLLNIVETV